MALRAQLTHESEALHNAVIQVYELSFGQIIYIDTIHLPDIIRAGTGGCNERTLMETPV
jgi:hypothetical protein